MHRLKTRSWQIAVLILFALGAQAVAQGAPGGGRGSGMGGQQGPREVGVMVVRQESVPNVVTLPGRAVAYQETGIRPQVGGEVRQIVYESGHPVKAGDVLFRLDPETLAAALAAAEASVAGAQASLESAQATVTRYRRLEGSGVSSVERSNAEVSLAQAEANLKAAEAARDSAELSLRRTDIVSPISGVPDVPAVSVGDLVTANQSETLTTITQLDPIYVDVNESSVRILRNRERIESGALTVGDGFQTSLILETGETYTGQGRFVSPGINVSATTGTIPIRLQFDNPERMILPGQFLRVEMVQGTTRAVLVPQRATRRASDGSLTAFVARDGKAQQTPLVESGSYKNSWIVTQGITDGDQIILDGLENLRSGQEITAKPVTIDANGIVRAAQASETATAPAPAEATSGSAAETAPQSSPVQPPPQQTQGAN